MRYVSIDIETLGLDSDWCDIIEFGAVVDDLISPIDSLPRFHCFVTIPDNKYCGEPYAMAMHSEILSKIARRDEGFTYVPSDLLDEVFYSWLKENDLNDKITIAGKNFATFDLKFLEKVGFGEKTKYHRRIIDVGSMFLQADDEYIPSLKECMTRANLSSDVKHTAIEDALDVVKCIRFKLC